MPELPEVEILARHLAPLLRKKTIRGVDVRRARTIAPTPEKKLREALTRATFIGLKRRGKYLLFELRNTDRAEPLLLLGHLGMTGRMYLLPKNSPMPKHAAVTLDLGPHNFVFEDTRYFGRLTLDASAIAKLGPEPLGEEFSAKYFATELKGSKQAIKVKLLDQSLVAGVGNIYASEALYRAGISPRLSAGKLTMKQIENLRHAIREVLNKAIRFGSTLSLDFAGEATRDGLFYYGANAGEAEHYEERLLVYDRAGQPCGKCGTPIRRFVQAARSTFYCPKCQRE